ISDNGTLADDSFRIAIDGLVVGTTQIGQANNLAINNLVRGNHTLSVTVLVAPDNVGTYLVELSNGWSFSDGSTSISSTGALGSTASYIFVVP
ncbi:unnamed protein product, partial [Phaeothamnion confervicola]